MYVVGEDSVGNHGFFVRGRPNEIVWWHTSPTRKFVKSRTIETQTEFNRLCAMYYNSDVYTQACVREYVEGLEPAKRARAHEVGPGWAPSPIEATPLKGGGQLKIPPYDEEIPPEATPVAVTSPHVPGIQCTVRMLRGNIVVYAGETVDADIAKAELAAALQGGGTIRVFGGNKTRVTRVVSPGTAKAVLDNPFAHAHGVGSGAGSAGPKQWRKLLPKGLLVVPISEKFETPPGMKMVQFPEANPVYRFYTDGRFYLFPDV